ncbi:MAG: hypothetical protein K2W33_10965 [Burkholderiales bacterium]|nr:hypothetical protein [Burkholderiales bacterium]
MSRHAMTTACLLGVALALSACGERPQTNSGLSAAKRDASPVTGTDAAVFRQRDWTPGDQASWAQQLKARAQYGMNDHSRTTQ